MTRRKQANVFRRNVDSVSSAATRRCRFHAIPDRSANARAFFRWYGRKKPEQRDDLRKRKKRGWQNIRQSLFEFCTANHMEHLLTEWDAARNAPLTPETVTHGSRKQVWWRCGKGHSYQTMVSSRARGTGCPVCANRVVLPEVNSLAAEYPLLAAQWDGEKNGGTMPSQVLSGTHKKAWWRCPQGHSWQASVVSRVHQGTGCPICSGRKVQPGENDLAARFPALAAEWDPDKNGTLTPEQVTDNSNRRVWWRCPRGHSYQAGIAHRARSSSGCPYCTGRKVLPGFNDLATLYPTLADQWHPTLNGDLTPSSVTVGCHRKVWWVCPENHVWKAVIYSRTGPQKCGCPVCAGKTRQNPINYAIL